jgi:hypothetical protein
MAISYKVLGQINPSANTLATLYTVPFATNTVISTITVCNQSTTPAAFSIAVRPAGVAIVNSHYINFDTLVLGNDTVALTLGITLAATDVLSCNANTSTVSFNAFGSELS